MCVFRENECVWAFFFNGKTLLRTSWFDVKWVSLCEGELLTVQRKPPVGAVFICINLLFISDTFLNNSLFMEG